LRRSVFCVPSMWFINFVLAAAVLVTALVLGSAVYLEQSAPSYPVVSAIIGPVPLPTPRPKPLVRESREEKEVVIAPKPSEVRAKPRRRGKARQATW
jgi:hypothetical protein